MENIFENSFSKNVTMVYDPIRSGYVGLDWGKLDDLEVIGLGYQDFSGDFDGSLNSSFTIDNSGGYNSIGFFAKNPSGGEVSWKGAFDGSTFTPITFRQVGNDGYAQRMHSGTASEDYIGSIATLRKIKFQTTIGGTTSGCIVGRMSRAVSTLEGIEHSSPPHKFGNALFHRGFSLDASTVAGSGIYSPDNNNKFAVTYISFGVSSTAGTNVTIYDGTGNVNNPNKWIFSTFVKTNANETQSFNVVLSSPFVSDTGGSSLLLDSDATSTIRGVVHGYQTEN